MTAPRLTYPPVSFGSPSLKSASRLSSSQAERCDRLERRSRQRDVARTTLDGRRRGQPAAVIETITVERRAFSEVDAAFAFEEGEGTGASRSGGKFTRSISAGKDHSAPA